MRRIKDEVVKRFESINTRELSTWKREKMIGKTILVSDDHDYDEVVI